MTDLTIPQIAWAAVGKKSGKVLRNLDGHLAIYIKREYAKADCPTYGEVRRVSLRVIATKVK